MSGGLSWAITEPSTNSTIECTIDCGCITTSICSAARSNSQRASTISSALFIIVAESIVIFGPMSQVGCSSACSTVTRANWSGGIVAKWAAAGREHNAFHFLALARRASIETRRCVRCRPAEFRRRCGRPSCITSGPAMTSVSLFASATRLPASSAAQVLCRPAAPTIAATTVSNFRPCDDFGEILFADQAIRFLWAASTNLAGWPPRHRSRRFAWAETVCACSNKISVRQRAARTVAVNFPCEAATTSKVLAPIEPVEPSTAILTDRALGIRRKKFERLKQGKIAVRGGSQRPRTGF